MARGYTPFKFNLDRWLQNGERSSALTAALRVYRACLFIARIVARGVTLRFYPA
jgi:hypothetical protein